MDKQVITRSYLVQQEHSKWLNLKAQERKTSASDVLRELIDKAIYQEKSSRKRAILKEA